MTAIAGSVQAFFTDRLVRQHQASPNTIASYRDTIRLLLAHLSHSTGIPASRLDWADLDAPRIAAFLDHLETERGNSVTTRNTRLAAIHSLFTYGRGHRAAYLRDHRTDPGRHPPRHRRQRRLPQEGPQGPGNTADPCHRHSLR